MLSWTQKVVCYNTEYNFVPIKIITKLLQNNYSYLPYIKSHMTTTSPTTTASSSTANLCCLHHWSILSTSAVSTWIYSSEIVRLVWFMVFNYNTTFNNISVISCRSVLLVKETGVPEENHKPVASHWQTLSHNAVSSRLHHSNSQF